MGGGEDRVQKKQTAAPPPARTHPADCAGGRLGLTEEGLRLDLA